MGDNAISSAKKVAFIKIGNFSFINESIVKCIKDEFPEFEVKIIDVLHFIKDRKHLFFTNMLFLIKEYGYKPSIIRHILRNNFFNTTYIFKKIKYLISKELTNDGYVFSFQTQSLFDASSPYLPHFVYTDHTQLANLYYPDFSDERLPTISWIEMEKTIYHNSTINFTMSTNISRSLINQYECDPSRVICVYAGSNVNMPDIKIDNDNYQNKNILFVGRDWGRKGGMELMEAFKAVLAVYPDARLTIVGCSPRIDLPNCDVVGRVPLSEVKKYYEKASVFCLPTKLEPFGIVLIEALHHKLPVVSTNIGAIPDFIIEGENGHLVKPYEIESLSRALISLIGNPKKCQDFGKKGYKLAIERYNWKTVGNLMKQNIVAALNWQ